MEGSHIWHGVKSDADKHLLREYRPALERAPCGTVFLLSDDDGGDAPMLTVEVEHRDEVALWRSEYGDIVEAAREMARVMGRSLLYIGPEWLMPPIPCGGGE